MSGGDSSILQKILGHKEYRSTERYTHLRQDYLAEKTGIVDFEVNLFSTDDKVISINGK